MSTGGVTLLTVAMFIHCIYIYKIYTYNILYIIYILYIYYIYSMQEMLTGFRFRSVLCVKLDDGKKFWVDLREAVDFQ